MALADRILDQSPEHGGIPTPHALVVGYRHGAARTLLNYRRLGAYTGAGLVSGAVNITLFHIAVRAHVQTHVAWALAFEIGALLAFILHRHVTWRDRRVHTLLEFLQQLWRAQAGALLALLLNLAVFTILVRAGLPADLDDTLGLVAGFAMNYALAHHFIFAPRRTRTRHP